MYPNLIAEMARKGITIKQLAGLANIPRQTFYSKMSGRAANGFSIDDAIAIRNALGVDIPFETLFKRTGR